MLQNHQTQTHKNHKPQREPAHPIPAQLPTKLPTLEDTRPPPNQTYMLKGSY